MTAPLPFATMRDLVREIEEHAARDARNSVNQNALAHSLERIVADALPESRLMADIALRPRVGLRVTSLEECDANALRLAYLAKFLTVIREGFEAVAEGLREAEGA